MVKEISKLCADSLRTFSKEKYNLKLKPSHAHELVAAYLGYKSRNGLLADKIYPISRLSKSEIIVMMPDEFIDQRRKSLDDLPAGLPDSYTLGEAVYNPLFSDDWWSSTYPPFRGYKQLAEYLVEHNDTYRSVFMAFSDIPIHHFVKVDTSENSTSLTVTHAYKTDKGEMLGSGQTRIDLPRVAGHIGYGSPKFDIGKWTGGARRTLSAEDVRS